MKGVESPLKECWILEPEVFEDNRGYFYEGYNIEKFKAITGINFEVKQLNQSSSSKGVLRGLHFQKSPYPQAKLVTCIEGEVMDVAVDLRKNSDTYKEHLMISLSDKNKKSLYLPKGFAHGFLVLSPYAKIMYQIDEVYSPEYDTGIIYNDPELKISWSLRDKDLILSDKDSSLPLLKDTKLDF